MRPASAPPEHPESEFHESTGNRTDASQHLVQTSHDVPEGTTSSPHFPPQGALIWQDPLTREVVYIDARTGFEIRDDKTERGTAGAGASGARAALPRRPGNPRLMRSASEYFLRPGDGSWVASMLQDWEQPIFKSAEAPIPQIIPEEMLLESAARPNDRSGIQAMQRASRLEGRITRADLGAAEIIAQVDSKFILIKLRPQAHGRTADTTDTGSLVLIDQHAADERIKVERLLQEFCQEPDDEVKCLHSPLGCTSAVQTTSLLKPLIFDIEAQEGPLFRRQAPSFARWGILYDLPTPPFQAAGPSSRHEPSSCRLVVVALPGVIAERCRTEPKHLIQILRGEAWRLHQEAGARGARPESAFAGEGGPDAWVAQVRGCPSGILDMIHSRSCRSAIMFNDELGMDDCRRLVEDLARCRFPFQCAHGRPSMIPLLDLGDVTAICQTRRGFRSNHRTRTDLGQAWMQWLGS